MIEELKDHKIANIVNGIRDDLVELGIDINAGRIRTIVHNNLVDHIKKPTITDEMVSLTAAVNALIGYTALKPDNVISKSYVDRLNDYYVTNVKAALKEALGGEDE